VVFAPLVAEVLSLPAKENPVIRSLDTKTRRDRRMSTIISIVGACAKQQPIFLLFDDVHWIDASSAELIAQIASHGAFPLLLCLTSRHEALPDDLSATRPECSLKLRELSVQASRDLVQQMTDVPSDIADAIVDRARGNPLFLRELSQSGASGKGELPESIYDVIMVRLDQLRNGKKSILQHAAVIGSAFDVSSLRDLMNSARRKPSETG
jgi:predicted ATPase